MNRIILFLILLSGLIFCSCNVLRTVNGFTQKYKRAKKEKSSIVLPLVIVKDKYSSSGMFIQLIHENGRKLDLFVPAEKEGKVNIKEVIKTVESNNNPNTWEFYYAPFASPSVDSVRLEDGALDWYDNYQTIIGQNELYNLKKMRKRGYVIKMQFVNEADFCLVVSESQYINNYNSTDRLQDGPNERKSKIPKYMFLEDVDKIRFLLPKSTFCE